MSSSKKGPKGSVIHLNFHQENASFERVKELID